MITVHYSHSLSDFDIKLGDRQMMCSCRRIASKTECQHMYKIWLSCDNSRIVFGIQPIRNSCCNVTIENAQIVLMKIKFDEKFSTKGSNQLENLLYEIDDYFGSTEFQKKHLDNREYKYTPCIKTSIENNEKYARFQFQTIPGNNMIRMVDEYGQPFLVKSENILSQLENKDYGFAICLDAVWINNNNNTYGAKLKIFRTGLIDPEPNRLREELELIHDYVDENNVEPKNFNSVKQHVDLNSIMIYDVLSMDNNKTIVYPTNNVRFYINKNKNEHAKQTNYLIRIEFSDTDRVENEIKTFLTKIDGYYGSDNFKKSFMQNKHYNNYVYVPCVKTKQLIDLDEDKFDSIKTKNTDSYCWICFDESSQIKKYGNDISMIDFNNHRYIRDKAVFLIKVDNIWINKNKTYGIGLKIIDILYGYYDTHCDTTIINDNCTCRIKFSNHFEVDFDRKKFEDKRNAQHEITFKEMRNNVFI